MHTTAHQEILIQVSTKWTFIWYEKFKKFHIIQIIYIYVQNDTEDILNLRVGYDVKKDWFLAEMGFYN